MAQYARHLKKIHLHAKIDEIRYIGSMKGPHIGDMMKNCVTWCNSQNLCLLSDLNENRYIGSAWSLHEYGNIKKGKSDAIWPPSLKSIFRWRF